jgi:hypothetical protein
VIQARDCYSWLTTLFCLLLGSACCMHSQTMLSTCTCVHVLSSMCVIEIFFAQRMAACRNAQDLCQSSHLGANVSHSAAAACLFIQHMNHRMYPLFPAPCHRFKIYLTRFRVAQILLSNARHMNDNVRMYTYLYTCVYVTRMIFSVYVAYVWILACKLPKNIYVCMAAVCLFFHACQYLTRAYFACIYFA